MFQSTILRHARVAVLAAGALALSGCLFTPGKFTSELVLTKGGKFAFSYEGEISTMGLSQMAKMDQGEPFEAHCMDDEGEVRDCTDAESDEQYGEWEADQAKDAAEKQQFMKMFGGMDPSDPEIAAKLVDTLKKLRGWEQVSYRGDGIYDVSFKASGVLTHTFMFPIVEDMPPMGYFVSAIPRADGSVKVEAPGFGGDNGGMGPGSMGMMAAMGAMQQQGGEDMAEIVLPDGTFTIRTDGEILTNNTDDGPAMDGKMRVLSWTVDQTSDTAPMALIRLK